MSEPIRRRATDLAKSCIRTGEESFVLVVSEGQFAGKPTSFYDLFRVHDGKVAEHWDTLEVIPARSESKNPNGKFGF